MRTWTLEAVFLFILDDNKMISQQASASTLDAVYHFALSFITGVY